MAESILVLITKAPYGSEDAFAGLMLALASKVSGYMAQVDVMLIGDGTLNTLEAQRPEAVGMPSNREPLRDLIELESEVYCVEEDLRSRAGGMKIVDGIRFIDWPEARSVLGRYQLVATF